MSNFDINLFIDFLRGRGIGPANSRDIIADDRIRRFDVDGDKRNSKNGTYRLGVVNGVMMGWGRSHKQGGNTHKFRDDAKLKAMSAAERAALTRQVELRKKDNEERLQRRHEAVAAIAADVWAEAAIQFGDHPYLKKKNIDGRRLRYAKAAITTSLQDGYDRPWIIPKNALLVPLYDIKGQIWSLQHIEESGTKRFLPGGRIKGLCHPIGQIKPLLNEPMVFCEGLATGKTLHRVFAYPTVCAIQGNNLPNVAALYRKKYPYTRFIFAADHDRWTKKQDGTPWNTGVHYAMTAAESTGGSVQTLPERLGQHASHPTDFNDMAALEGDVAVKACFAKVLA